MGNFSVYVPDNLMHVEVESDHDSMHNGDVDSDLLGALDMASVSSVTDPVVNAKRNELLTIPADEQLSRPEIPAASDSINTPVTDPVKRFISVTDEQLQHFEDQVQSKSTKMNTKWAVGILQGYYDCKK